MLAYLEEVLHTVSLSIWQIVLADHSTANDPCELIGLVQHNVQGLATNVLKVDVNAIWCMLFQGLTCVCGFVVEGSVKAKILQQSDLQWNWYVCVKESSEVYNVNDVHAPTAEACVFAAFDPQELHFNRSERHAMYRLPNIAR